MATEAYTTAALRQNRTRAWRSAAAIIDSTQRLRHYVERLDRTLYWIGNRSNHGACPDTTPAEALWLCCGHKSDLAEDTSSTIRRILYTIARLEDTLMDTYTVTL